MKPVHISLHFFGDASEKAYAACCYARVQNSEGDVHVSFVMSRMRVTPVGRRQLSLPRLELQAAVLSTRLYGLIQKELDLNVQEVFFWSDSNTVLQYLANTTRRFKVFVGNRVAEILSTTAIYQWRHCPGSLNPSDLATRGMRIPDLKTRNAWLHGPDFLWKPNDQWPKMLIPESIPDADTECRATQSHHTTITAQEDFMDPCRYSSLSRLLNVTGWCLRYVQNGKTMIAKSDSKSRNLNKYLSVDELSQAKAFWIKSAQLDVFAGEISALKNNINTSKETHSGEPKAVVRPSSTLVKLRPFLEDTSTFLRVGGRIGEANIPYGCKHQIILPKSHRITELIVHDCHVRLQHGSSETIITKLRETFWIPAIRPLVKKVINACPLCKRELAKPAIPVMADLPTARLQESIWSHTGVDTFGPLQIKQGRRNLKVWVLLFCSMTIRAIHLELIRTTDTDSFIMAWRRFISRRGKVLKLYSDPGSNFTGADPELRKAFKELHSDEKFGKYLTSEGIEFAFNPPKASHMGGAWESLIKGVKRSLRIVLGQRIVHEDTLSTALCEIESAINSRPLTYVGNDTGYSPLTPNHFLHHVPTSVSQPNVPHETHSLSRKRWLQSQLISHQLWQRWRREYLPTITLANKWHRHTRNLSVGDVVLLVDRTAPRGCWPLARVVEVYPSRDSRVRSVKVKTKNGEVIRPASHICLLEEGANPQ
jgi:hypothetical protein